MGDPVAAGVPKSGDPSGRQPNFCIRMARSQPGSVSTLEWYTIQSSVPSGETVKLACPTPYTVAVPVNTGPLLVQLPGSIGSASRLVSRSEEHTSELQSPLNISYA